MPDDNTPEDETPEDGRPDPRPPEPTPAFPHGVASFDPAADSVLLWTRAPGGGELAWTVARDSALADVVAAGRARVDVDADATVTVEVTGLDPATTYHYGFARGHDRSPTGRTRTLPSGSTERVRMGVVSCANLARAPLTTYRALAGIDDLDLVLHLGDYVYEDDGERGEIPVDPPRYLVTAEDYRARYRQARADTDLQQLHARHPFVTVWDDHDVADNCWDGGAKAHDPDEHGRWAERLAAATAVRQEYLPARLADPGAPGRLWRSLPLGDLAELVVLDARLGGRDQQLDSVGAGIDDPDRHILGPEQWAWAEERLTDTTRPWTLVASGVPVSAMRLPMPEVDLDGALPEGYTVQDGIALCTDQWDGYGADQRHLAEVLDRRGGGAVIVSADVHSSWVFDGPFAPDGRPVAAELTGSSVSSTTLGANLGSAAARLAERIATGLDHVRWVDLDEHGFMVVDVDRRRVRGEMWRVDPWSDDARAERMTAWAVGPDAGARWRPDDGDGDDRDDQRTRARRGHGREGVVEGPPALGPPAGGRVPPSRIRRVGATAARGVAVAVVAVLARPVLRPVLRRLRARRR